MSMMSMSNNITLLCLNFEVFTKMNEFLKLSWRIKAHDIDPRTCFLSEEAVSDSYVYKSFTKPIEIDSEDSLDESEKYVPGKSVYKLIYKRSLLTKSQKQHCLRALKLHQTGKNPETMTAAEKYSIQIYTECQSKIVEENKNFLEFIENIWNRTIKKPVKIQRPLLNHSWNHWKQKIKKYLDYSQFYKEVSLISLNYNENEGTVDYKHTQTPLEVGTVARFAKPSLIEPCILKMDSMPKSDDEILFNSKLVVSEDQNIVKLLETYDFNVVITSSGLKQIFDFTNTKTKWILPVVIKKIGDKKIVFIDKVLPKVTPNHHDLKYYAYKKLLKANFCKYKAFDYMGQEIPVTVNKTENEKTEVTTENSSGSSSDIKNVNKRKIFHNVSYRIWNIKKTAILNTLMKNIHQHKDINLLVRCKLDACEISDQGPLFSVIIEPKLEQQLQYGANIPSKSELGREWASLFFRVYSNLYRVRMNGSSGEVISLEKCSMQKINNEALTHYEYRPMLGLGVLQKVLEDLTNLECGNYLLHHLPKHESFVAVLKETDQKTPDCFDLHSECVKQGIDAKTRQSWLPIDVNYILPVHEEYNQIPAVFHGFDNNNKAQNKGTKRKKKSKMKKKVQEEGQPSQ